MKYCDPRYDVTFKKVFGQHAELLLSFLNALLPLKGDQVIESIEYLTPEMIPEIPNAKFSVVDVQCKDKAERKFVVEMQMVWSEEFKSRVLFNASKAYVSQLEKGKEYKILQPVYSLNIVNDIFDTDLPKDEYYHYYQLVHDKHSDKVIEGLHIAFVELPKFKPKNEEETKMRDLWLRFLTEINEATKTVPSELTENPLTNKAVALMEEAGMTDGERYAYYKNIDNVWVEQAIMRTCKAKGLAEGRAEGIAKGRAEGIAEGRAKGIAEGRAEGIAEGEKLGESKAKLETARKMLNLGIDMETIRNVTGLTEADIHSEN
jgi:predicted transposase/invertase (TIGR01784 family)